MPQAVESFINNKDYNAVDNTKKEILALYENDIRKKDLVNGRKGSLVFKTLTSQIANNKSHFKYSIINKSARALNYIDAVSFLEESMIVNVARNLTDPQVELSTSIDYSDIKMFFGDTGLFITKAMNDNRDFGNDLYKRIIFDKDSSNLGPVYENIVSQMLKAKGYDLLFNTYKYIEKSEKDKTKETNNISKKFEIDFIIRNNKHIIPIEVKSSAYKNHKSLDCFYKKFNIKRDKSYIIYTNNYKEEDNIIYLPVYMIPFVF